jgi:superfamily II DNA helicase RecQ
LKEVRRDVVRSLGTMFFQHMPDELLRSLIEQPPKSLEGLRDDFEVHDKIIENFGKRILHLLSEGQDQPHVSQTRSNVGRPASPGYFLGVEEASGASPVRKKDRTSAAKVAAAMKVAGGKVGEVYGSEVEARFERLRTLRLELARARGWRAFRILHDTTLLEVARVRPRTVRELMKIKGIGEQKAADFGKELLAELARE